MTTQQPIMQKQKNSAKYEYKNEEIKQFIHQNRKVICNFRGDFDQACQHADIKDTASIFDTMLAPLPDDPNAVKNIFLKTIFDLKMLCLYEPEGDSTKSWAVHDFIGFLIMYSESTEKNLKRIYAASKKKKLSNKEIDIIENIYNKFYIEAADDNEEAIKTLLNDLYVLSGEKKIPVIPSAPANTPAAVTPMPIISSEKISYWTEVWFTTTIFCAIVCVLLYEKNTRLTKQLFTESGEISPDIK